MLSRLIVVSYVWLLEVALWFSIALAAVVGYYVTMPIMSFAGLVLAPELAWKFVGALALAAITFLFLAVVVGPILVLIDIRRAVRKLEAGLEQGEGLRRLPSSERREPSI